MNLKQMIKVALFSKMSHGLAPLQPTMLPVVEIHRADPERAARRRAIKALGARQMKRRIKSARRMMKDFS
jgi:hypothetical protein